MLLSGVMEGQIAGADVQLITDQLHGGVGETPLQKQSGGNLNDFLLCGVDLLGG